MKTAIITGITGQDGAYLSKLLLENDYKVIGLIRSYHLESTWGLEYVGVKDKVIIEECDLLDITNIFKIFNKYNPDEIYNLAAQSSVGVSFQQPIGTIQFNVLSVLNILESIKTLNKDIKFYQASSSEMFGKIDCLPITEDLHFYPLSPYAISKAAAHWSAVNYKDSYGIFACCGILFNHESFLRSENFFIKKVIKTAIEIKNGKKDRLAVGNIDIRRDFGYAPKYVEAMWLMMQQKNPDNYIICSGKSISLREIVYKVFDTLKIDRSLIVEERNLFRPSEIENIYGDNSRAVTKLGWKYDMDFFDVVELLIDEELNHINIPRM